MLTRQPWTSVEVSGDCSAGFNRQLMDPQILATMRHRTPAQSPNYKCPILGQPSTILELKESVHLRHCGKAPCEDSAICNQSGHNPLFIRHLPIPIHLRLILHAPRFGPSATRVGSFILSVDADSELVASLDEAYLSSFLDRVVPFEFQIEEVAVLDPEERVDCETVASSKLDVDLPSESEIVFVCEPISVHLSSDLKALTTLKLTFRGVPLVTRYAVVAIVEPGGT